MTSPAEEYRAQNGAAAAGVPPFPALAAVFLDIDGTLVRLADHPAEVDIDAPLRALLTDLCNATSGAVALISGRAIHDIDALFSPMRFAAAGQHGAERRSADGTLHFHAPLESRLQGIAQEMQRLVQVHPGLLLESKGASLALHFRREPDLGPLVESESRRLLATLGDGFELQAGKLVFEIKPSGKDKGTAIAEFMGEAPFAGRLPVFMGDDLTDEYGFAMMNALGGISVKVGPGQTQARWRMNGIDAVRSWLRSLAIRISNGQPGAGEH